jgi:hypothetical protein
MSIRAKQIVAGLLAATAATVGGWASLAPESFYRSFPLPGHHWVSALPAYNEHLVRDVGAFYLGFLVMSAWALLRPREETFRLLGAGWLIFGLPHLAFHAAHLSPFSTADAVENLVSLTAAVLLAVLLMLPQRSVGGWQ